jgi:hypothetical protein
VKSSSLWAGSTDSPICREYRDALIHDWNFHQLEWKAPSVYLLGKVLASKLFAKIQDGEIKIQGHQYSVIWVSGPMRIRKEGAYCLVSLRYCTLLNRGYALIRRHNKGHDQDINTYLEFTPE